MRLASTAVSSADCSMENRSRNALEDGCFDAGGSEPVILDGGVEAVDVTVPPDVLVSFPSPPMQGARRLTRGRLDGDTARHDLSECQLSP